MALTYSIPGEIIENILGYVPINVFRRCFVGMYPDAPSGLCDKLFKERIDPHKCLGILLEVEPALFQMMTYYGIVMIGPRVMSHLYATHILDSTPWEFCCQSHGLSVIPFITQLESRGVKWKEINNSFYEKKKLYCIKGTTVYKEENINITLVWNSTKLSYRSLSLSTIFSLPSSAYTCIMSGFGISDMSYKLHSTFQILLTEDTDVDINDQYIYKCHNNYVPKDFEPIVYMAPEEWNLIDRKERYISDKLSLWTDFTMFAENSLHLKYMKYMLEYRNHPIRDSRTSISSFETLEGVEIPFEKFIRMDFIHSSIKEIKAESDKTSLSNRPPGMQHVLDGNIYALLYKKKPQWIRDSTWMCTIHWASRRKGHFIPF